MTVIIIIYVFVFIMYSNPRSNLIQYDTHHDADRQTAGHKPDNRGDNCDYPSPVEGLRFEKIITHRFLLYLVLFPSCHLCSIILYKH